MPRYNLKKYCITKIVRKNNSVNASSKALTPSTCICLHHGHRLWPGLRFRLRVSRFLGVHVFYSSLPLFSRGGFSVLVTAIVRRVWKKKETCSNARTNQRTPGSMGQFQGHWLRLLKEKARQCVSHFRKTAFPNFYSFKETYLALLCYLRPTDIHDELSAAHKILLWLKPHIIYFLVLYNKGYWWQPVLCWPWAPCCLWQQWKREEGASRDSGVFPRQERHLDLEQRCSPAQSVVTRNRICTGPH